MDEFPVSLVRNYLGLICCEMLFFSFLISFLHNLLVNQPLKPGVRTVTLDISPHVPTIVDNCPGGKKKLALDKSSELRRGNFLIGRDSQGSHINLYTKVENFMTWKLLPHKSVPGCKGSWKFGKESRM